MTLLSVGILSANWRTEKDPEQAKKSAMDYFWEPKKVAGDDVTRAIAKFNEKAFLEKLNEQFLSWADDDGNTFLHILALKSKNSDLLRSVLGLGADMTRVNNNGETAKQLASKSMKQILSDYEEYGWKSGEYPARSVWSEENIADQKMALFLVILGAIYYRWRNYQSDDNKVIV